MVSAVHSNTNAQTSNNSSVNNSSKSWFSGFWFWNTSPPTEGEPSKFTAKELAEAIKNAFSKGQHSDLEELKINSSNINTQNNGKDKEDLTALHYAAGAGVYYSNNDRIEIIKFLIANNANVNIKSQNGWTPLHFACHKGLFEVAKLLLDAGADINAKENYGNTPLKTAFNYAFTIPSKVPELLIIAGADVNLKDNYNTSPLHEASTQKDLEIVKLLLTAGADINAKDKSGRTALLLASNRYNQKLNCEIKAKSEKRHGDIAVIENSYFNSAKMMNLLNDIENKLNNEGWTPFHFASCFDNKEFIKLYISKFDIDTITNDKVTPLHIAACNGHKELVEILIKANANIHSKTSDNWTPLHFAAHNGRIDIVKLLLINGASFDEEDNYKNTPIRLASQNNHTEIVKYLRNYISEIKENSELIHYPSYLVHTKILRLFIDYGANALHTSSKYGNLKAIQFIISQGADINEKDSFGWTPLHFATSGKMSGSFEDNSINASTGLN